MLVGRLRRSLQAEGTLGQNALIVSSLRRKDLTQAQAQYLVAYEPGDVLMPTQNYKKQGLAKYQHYTVRSIDRVANRLLVETADSQLLSVDPAQCRRKTVYAAQKIDIAVGDLLRWTKNDRRAKTRNGQQFTVAEILTNGVVRTVEASGQSRWFSLAGQQHVDYAWVSTTYGSQGKTAERVLALMSDKTTNRESFYVAVSRAKHGLMLYAADKHELINRAQKSRAKENASDYVPLFIQVGENDAKTKKENDGSTERASAVEGRGIELSVGAGVGERASASRSIDTLGYQRTESASRAGGERNAGFNGELESIADIFEEHVEPLSFAIAGHVEHSELIDCEGFFEDAVAAVNQGVEQLEWAAKNRTQLAAAVDRLDQAVGGEAGSARSKTMIGGQLKPATHDYGKLWEHYRRGAVASSAGELDYRVGRRAFKDGVKQRAIALMLASSSSIVEQLHYNYGKQKAMQYVNQMARRICQQQTIKAVRQLSSSRQVELD